MPAEVKVEDFMKCGKGENMRRLVFKYMVGPPRTKQKKLCGKAEV